MLVKKVVLFAKCFMIVLAMVVLLLGCNKEKEEGAADP